MGQAIILIAACLSGSYDRHVASVYVDDVHYTAAYYTCAADGAHTAPADVVVSADHYGRTIYVPAGAWSVLSSAGLAR